MILTVRFTGEIHGIGGISGDVGVGVLCDERHPQHAARSARPQSKSTSPPGSSIAIIVRMILWVHLE